MQPSQKHLLTEQQLAIVRQAVADGLRRDEIAEAAGITPYVLTQRLKDQLAGLHLRRGARGGRRAWPFPEEIELRKIDVRAKWPPSRWGLHDPRLFHPTATAPARGVWRCNVE